MHDYDRSNKTAASEKSSASEMDVAELPPAQAKFVKKLEAEFGKPVQAWEGIHGIIVEFKGRNSGRLMKDALKLLMGNSIFRWVDADKDRISVGM